MSVLRIADLYARSERRPDSSCWFWLGAKSLGSSRIWTFDHDRIEKRAMSGPRAVWNIAKQCGLGERLAYMRCVNGLCVNPSHVGSAVDKAEIGANVRLTGKRKGTAIESRRANVAKAWAANGVMPTSPEKVAAVRAWQGSGREIARMLGLSDSVVSQIRLGRSHRAVLEAA